VTNKPGFFKKPGLSKKENQKTAKIPHNLLTNRSTITNEHDFIVREQEITNLLSLLREGD
jgi:hypothetical protein